jgi:hypothetical protein
MCDARGLDAGGERSADSQISPESARFRWRARLLPNVQDEPRPWLARAVLLGARDVTAMVVGSGALLGRLDSGSKCTISGWWITSN